MEARIQRAFPKGGDDYVCGTEFIIRSEEDLATSIRFVYSDSQRWVDYWNRNALKPSILKVLLFILKMSLKGYKTIGIASLVYIVSPLKNLLRYVVARFFRAPVVVAESKT